MASVLDAELAALAGTGDETTLCDPPPALHACERRWESSSKSLSLPQPLLSSETNPSLPHALPAMAADTDKPTVCTLCRRLYVGTVHVETTVKKDNKYSSKEEEPTANSSREMRPLIRMRTFT